ncbi:MTRR reductase, partial [Amia calva]|nr:MTRR reductase [Amia calva]
MPCEVKTRFLLLYGSQSGQAKAIAEEICQQADEHGFKGDICCMSESAKYNLETETDPVVIVVSTTGDGEPPEKALQFVKGIRTKTLPPDHYAHLPLGDSNYAEFCKCGKTIDKRLQELGAKHFYATGHADDGVGLELVVDPWIEGLWEAIRKAYSNMSDPNQERNDRARTGQNGEPAESADNKQVADLKIQLLRINDSNDLSPDLPEPSLDKGKSGTETTPLGASLTTSISPLSESTLNIPALPPQYIHVELMNTTTKEENFIPPDQEAEHQVPVTRAVQLSREDAVKTALLLELDISGTHISYQPGDSLNVFCPNNSGEVEELIQRLGLAEMREHCVHLQLRTDTKKKAAQLPSYVPEKSTLKYLLTWCLEIRSIPKKAFLRALVDYTTNAAEKRRLQELCSKQGSSDYNHLVRDPNLSVLELLLAFPSCSPPLSLLIEQLPKLRPRSYSAASSSLYHPGKLHFVFNIVEFPQCSGRAVPRRGVCTGWLSELISPILQQHGRPSRDPDSALVPKVSIGLRPSTAFHLPSDPAVPFIMVGPGTGVAPFIGFLQHRAKQRQENPDTEFGETWLFFGCRHKDREFLFRDELEHFVENGTLTHLKVCFSRDAPKGPEPAPKYVQHNLCLHAQDVARILLQQNGCIYVCGDAKNMAKDVNETLIEIVGKELTVDKLEAMKVVAELRDKKCYMQDVWA